MRGAARRRCHGDERRAPCWGPGLAERGLLPPPAATGSSGRAGHAGCCGAVRRPEAFSPRRGHLSAGSASASHRPQPALSRPRSRLPPLSAQLLPSRRCPAAAPPPPPPPPHEARRRLRPRRARGGQGDAVRSHRGGEGGGLWGRGGLHFPACPGARLRGAPAGSAAGHAGGCRLPPPTLEGGLGWLLRPGLWCWARRDVAGGWPCVPLPPPAAPEEQR